MFNILFPPSYLYQNPHRFYTSNFIPLVLQWYYFIFPIFPLKFFSGISFVDIFCPNSLHSYMLYPYSFQYLLFSLVSILFLNNILLSINPISFSYLCLLRYFGYTRLFPSPSRAICLTISSFLNFPIYISFLDLSSLCFAGSLLVALTARNQYIPLHISYPYFEPPSRPLPLILTHQSHNAATLITCTSSLFYLFSFLAHF